MFGSREEAQNFMENHFVRSRTLNHKWSPPEMTGFHSYNDKRVYLDDAYFTQICSVCNSTKKTKLIFYRFSRSWGIYCSPQINHKKNYHDTECYKFYKQGKKYHDTERYKLYKQGKRKLTDLRKKEKRLKKRKLTDLRKKEKLLKKGEAEKERTLLRARELRVKLLRARELVDEKAEFRRKQVAKNLAIVKNFSGLKFKHMTLNKLRRNLAIYRLYQYCDLTEKQISMLLGFKLSVHAIRTIIGNTYRFLCITDESCVLRFMFLDDREGGRHEHAILVEERVKKMGQTCILS